MNTTQENYAAKQLKDAVDRIGDAVALLALLREMLPDLTSELDPHITSLSAAESALEKLRETHVSKSIKLNITRRPNP